MITFRMKKEMKARYRGVTITIENWSGFTGDSKWNGYIYIPKDKVSISIDRWQDEIPWHGGTTYYQEHTSGVVQVGNDYMHDMDSPEDTDHRRVACDLIRAVDWIMDESGYYIDAPDKPEDCSWDFVVDDKLQKDEDYD